MYFKELLESNDENIKKDRMSISVSRVYDDIVIQLDGQINIPTYKTQSKEAMKVVEAEYEEFIKRLEKRLENK